jgi:hypothetical protein
MSTVMREAKNAHIERLPGRVGMKSLSSSVWDRTLTSG